MAYFNSRGLRGSSFEEIINLTNDVYRDKNLAIIQKIPTHITPVKFNNQNKTITLAYFNQKSTVDYIGVVQGIPICFDAKEVSRSYLPLQNIHQHQLDFMKDYKAQGGISFLLVYFKLYDDYFLLPLEVLTDYYLKSQKGGRKSIPYDDFDKKYLINLSGKFYLHYLEPLNIYLQGE